MTSTGPRSGSGFATRSCAASIPREGKSDLSTRRSVPMADRLAGELDRWSKRTVYNSDEDLVFAHPQTGNPLDRTKVTQAIPGGVPRRWAFG